MLFQKWVIFGLSFLYAAATEFWIEPRRFNVHFYFIIYNRQGYNEVGRNRQGKYNRYYNVKCYKTGLYSDEGFLDIRKNPLYLTNHARERMYERMGINNSQRMNELAFEAYQFGKSKLQLMKSERGIIEEKELEYGDSVILIYRGYCYVFSENNGLKTVYKNDRVRI